MTNNLFLSGTDTGIGKTVVAAWSCCCCELDYYKPLQCGLDDDGIGDTERVRRWGGLGGDRCPPSAVTLPLPRAPYESRAVALGELTELPKTANNRLLIEGVGGLLVPLNRRQHVIDLPKVLGLGVVLVAAAGLGTLNHTLLSLEALAARDIPCYGLILHGENEDSANYRFFKSRLERVIYLPWFNELKAAEFVKHRRIAREFYGGFYGD